MNIATFIITFADKIIIANISCAHVIDLKFQMKTQIIDLQV